MTQEELAEAASLSPRSISDLERGINATARPQTARLLADALGLNGPQRAHFEATARGRGPGVSAVGSQGPRGGSAAAATRTLPRDISGFTGRTAELARLTTELTSAAPGGVVGIHAIGGMAGIGKTALAVHAAHRLAGQFPDGQIFLPLHAHTPGQRPVDPADALASLLRAAGLGAQAIPAGLDARAACWRDYLAGQKVLLVLDDATGHEQVRPLLPGTAGSLVLITSRRRMTALEDAVVISLDTLPPDEATQLLARLAARPDVRPGETGVAEITRPCGYLPLAIGMLARQLHHHPVWAPAGLAAELAAARGRLELMHAENLSVAAAFNLSYQDLTAGQRRLFRRLGLHPGPDIGAHAAAALDGTSLATARRQLHALYDDHLISEPASGRYQPVPVRVARVAPVRPRTQAGRAHLLGDLPCLHVYAFLFRHMAIIATHYEIEMCVPFERLPPGRLATVAGNHHSGGYQRGPCHGECARPRSGLGLREREYRGTDEHPQFLDGCAHRGSNHDHFRRVLGRRRRDARRRGAPARGAGHHGRRHTGRGPGRAVHRAGPGTVRPGRGCTCGSSRYPAPSRSSPTS